MSKNDPKDPTSWTPDFIAAFNGVTPKQAVSWSPDYKSEPSSLPAGTYRVMDGNLYRVEPGLPPSLDTRTLRTRAEQAEADLRAYQKRCADFEDALNRAEAEREQARDLWNAEVEHANKWARRAREAEAERDRYRSALRDVAREWPYLDLIDPQTAQECDLRGLVEYLLGAVRSEQRVAREALEGHTDA